MKKLISTGLAAVLTIFMLTAVTSAVDSASVQFDFGQSDSGFVPIFADYPNTEDAEEFYELRHSWGEVPIPGAGKGLFISGSNHSDDLFMGYVKMLDGFAPARTYHFTVSFKLATDVEGGLVGVGGSPGESVAVKCGITSTRPATIPVDNGAFPYHRMNIDTGRQGSGGKDMVVVGDMTKTENNRPGEYEFKEFHAEFDAAADIRGKVYLIIATDSGFEATTSYYLDDILVSWADTEQSAATRGQAAQMLFDTADRANADPKNCIFQDVAEDAPYAEAITWAQQNGYVNGYGDGRFGPEDSMTVEQAMVVIYRFFGSPSADLSILDGLECGGQISPWARKAMAWALANDFLCAAEEVIPQSAISVEDLTYSLSQIVVATQ